MQTTEDGTWEEIRRWMWNRIFFLSPAFKTYVQSTVALNMDLEHCDAYLIFCLFECIYI